MVSDMASFNFNVSKRLYGVSRCLFLFWLFVLLPLLHGQQKSTKEEQLTEQTYTDRNAYEIYASLLHKEVPLYSPVVVSSIRRASLVGGIKGDQQFDNLWRAAIEDCEKQSEKPRLLTFQFPYGVYRLIPSSEIRELFESKGLDEGWHAFYERYANSGGYYDFSAVGFNSSHSRAIVETWHSCGPLCGEGVVHFFEKRAENWTEVQVDASVPHMTF